MAAEAKRVPVAWLALPSLRKEVQRGCWVLTHCHSHATEQLKFDDEGSREERVFKFWINSLGVPVRNLIEDLKDGLVLLRVLDILRPKCVNWNNICLAPKYVNRCFFF